MDILYQLPFPKEVCSKIFIFACKSPHSGLGVSILKKKIQTIELDIPEKDEDVIIFKTYEIINYPDTIYIDLGLYRCFHNLIEIVFTSKGVSGDIACLNSLTKLNILDIRCDDNKGLNGDIINLKSLTNLTTIFLGNSSINGNIKHLKSLKKLKSIVLYKTNVIGNISELKTLENLIEVRLDNTNVYGDIDDLKSLSNIFRLLFNNTNVSGNEELFHKYRKSQQFTKCRLVLNFTQGGGFGEDDDDY
jgi:hypothetical protein